MNNNIIKYISNITLPIPLESSNFKISILQQMANTIFIRYISGRYDTRIDCDAKTKYAIDGATKVTACNMCCEQ